MKKTIVRWKSLAKKMLAVFSLQLLYDADTNWMYAQTFNGKHVAYMSNGYLYVLSGHNAQFIVETLLDKNVKRLRYYCDDKKDISNTCTYIQNIFAGKSLEEAIIMSDLGGYS